MKKMPTVIMLIARILIGAYLAYLGIDLFKGAAASGNLKIVFYVVSVAFVIFGSAAVILGIKDMATGNYAGGPQDADKADLTEDNG